MKISYFPCTHDKQLVNIVSGFLPLAGLEEVNRLVSIFTGFEVNNASDLLGGPIGVTFVIIGLLVYFVVTFLSIRDTKKTTTLIRPFGRPTNTINIKKVIIENKNKNTVAKKGYS